MDAANLERKLEGYQLIINRAIQQQKYHIAIAAVKNAIQINPVCYITQALLGIIHHRQGRYDLSSQNLTDIITSVDSDTLQQVKSLLNNYDIPSDLTYYECLQDIHTTIKNKKIIKILFLLVTSIIAVVVALKLMG